VGSYDYESRRAVQAVRSAQLHENMDEDIVYSGTEKYSRKASESTTTRSITTSSLISNYLKGALAILLGLFFRSLLNDNIGMD